MVGGPQLAFAGAAAIAGIVAHEGAHYVACRAFGAPASPAMRWVGLSTVPCIETDILHLTPTTCRIVALAPLVTLLASLGGIHALGPWIDFTDPTIALATVAWISTQVPSGTDWRIAYDASELPMLQAVAEGPHPTHQAAEGIAA